MRSFKVYYEDRSTALIPKGGTLEDFLRSLEGKTISQILDDSSYMRLYHGNKYGMRGAPEGSDADNADKFVRVLNRWVNRDISQKRPKVREYETEEFKKEHNYDSYKEARGKKARLGMERIKARRAEDTNKLEEVQAKIDKLEDFISNHAYQRGMSMIEREYDDAVKEYHNSPLTYDYLKDDGSELYNELVTAFRELGGDSETVIDV